MYQIIKYDPQINPTHEFGCDTIADISTLPTHESDGIEPGSNCIVLEDTSVWMLGGDDVWKEI